jgi:hypothetical protein
MGAIVQQGRAAGPSRRKARATLPSNECPRAFRCLVGLFVIGEGALPGLG